MPSTPGARTAGGGCGSRWRSTAACWWPRSIGGIITGSLALLADAGHVLSDVGSIVLALIAARLAPLPAAGRRTFGYQRSEVLAALVNGLLLVVVSVAIAVAAFGRFADPPEIEAAACSRSASSAWSATSPRPGPRPRPARGHQPRGRPAPLPRRRARLARRRPRRRLGPARRLPIVDPIVGLLIAVLVLASSWRLIKEPFDVLMEAAPADLDVDGIGAAICEEEGVRSVHDLHVWTVTAGFGAIAAHVVVARDCDRDLIRRRLELILRERFGIEHTTLQMEEEADQGLLQVENAPRKA